MDAGVLAGRTLFEIFVPFGRLFNAFNAAKRDIFIQLKVPVCDDCRKRKIKPEVQSYDLEAREIRLVVHKGFRDLILQE